jgi:hypothetical protein
MKMMFLSYKESLDDEVMANMDKYGIQSFTKWKQVQDKGESGYPRMGTHIWPGYNSALMFVVDDDIARDLMCDVRNFNKEREFEGIKAMSWTVDDVCEE